MKVKLTVGEVQALDELVKSRRGRGGFQNLIRQIWYRLDETSGEIELPILLLERINRYAFEYGNTGWRRSLRKVFRRTLGVNLDDGLKLK